MNSFAQHFRFFTGGLVLCLLLLLPVLTIVLDFKLAFIISLLIGFIFGLFCLGFMQRVLKSESIEVNAGNKHKDRPLSWYEERIREQIHDLPFRYDETVDGVEVYIPRALYKVYEPNIYLEITPYDIKFTGSRLMVRLVRAYIELV